MAEAPGVFARNPRRHQVVAGVLVRHVHQHVINPRLNLRFDVAAQITRDDPQSIAQLGEDALNTPVLMHLVLARGGVRFDDQVIVFGLRKLTDEILRCIVLHDDNRAVALMHVANHID